MACPAAAENAFQQGLAIDANSEALLYALAVLYIQQQRTDLAGPVVSRLLELSPDNPDYLNLLRNMR